MEFVIKKGDLVRELQTVTGVVEKRATIPILANLLLEARPEGLQVGAGAADHLTAGLHGAEDILANLRAGRAIGFRALD